jgi:gluconokinase
MIAAMPHVPGLRSPYDKVGRLVYFGRLLDKIRLHAAGRLPADYVANLGQALPGRGFDDLCCTFLRVRYDDLRARVLADDLDDERLLAWCLERGGARSDDDCRAWNAFMTKRGWRDDACPRLRQRIAEFDLAGKPIETFFDLLDYDEGRDPAATQPWLH